MKFKNIIYNKQSIQIRLDSDADESVFDEIFTEREYQSLENIIQAARNPIIDIGAHIGIFTIYVRALNPEIAIFAYEPGAANFQLLKENLKLNHFEKNIFAKNVALGEKEGIREFFINEDSHNNSLINLPETIKTEKVQTTTLSKILEKMESCDLIKMDCEGAEFEILKSLAPEDFGKIKNIYIEYHEYEPEMKVIDLKQILEKNSFKVKATPSRYDQRMGFIMAML